jgi:Mn-dependent DtxR family transcriptional regulator
VTHSAAQSGSDALLATFDRAARSSSRPLVRWLTQSGVSLLPACALLILDPEDGPRTLGEVAEAVGISADDAAHALHELRSKGYAREENRRYMPTDEGLRLHASLASARLEALTSFLSSLAEDERRALAEAASHDTRR